MSDQQSSPKDASRYDIGFDAFLDTISPVWEVQREGHDKDLLYHDGQLRAAYEAGVRSVRSEIGAQQSVAAQDAPRGTLGNTSASPTTASAAPSCDKSETPRTDNGPWPRPQYAQEIVFEGCGCFAIAPEEYTALYESHAKFERELNAARSATGAMPEGFERCPIGLDSHPTFCSASTCTPCRAWREYMKQVGTTDSRSDK